MASWNRRDFLKLPAGAGLASVAFARPVFGSSTPAKLPARAFTLDNGFKVHVLEADFGYTALMLSLRSREIMQHNGLAHIMEHTSFVGAAGDLTARQIEEAWKNHVQESNASTSLGEILWSATFLPEHLERVIELLALASLDQRFDEATVEQERQIVLQELYEAKYGSQTQGRRQFEETLYGRDHPLVRDTTDAEIKKASTPGDKLARELRAFAPMIRLPSNMTLFVLGSLDGARRGIENVIAKNFGRYPAKSGPILKLPHVPRTAHYKRLTKSARDLKRPLCELEMAWNTGVTVRDADAPTLTLLAEYANAVLFERIREESGDAYSPQATFEVYDFAGIFSLYLTTTRDPRKVEKRVLDILCEVKKSVAASELARFKDRFELKRRREQRVDESLLDNMMQRCQYGLALADFDIRSVTTEQVRAAASAYLPGYRGAYVRLARMGGSTA